jgi:hypothetical protein
VIGIQSVEQRTHGGDLYQSTSVASSLAG